MQTHTEQTIVIESVFEDLELKKDVFRNIDKLCPEKTILASNTSTLLPSLLGEVTKRADKTVVMHFFNPPYLLPLVEIVRGKKTSDKTVNTIHALLSKMGKSPAIVKKEVPGFIGNRLQAALAREALSLVEQGIASAEDVDIVIKKGFGRRLAAAGVFEIFDIAGWDFALKASSYLLPYLDSSTEISDLVKQKVKNGELGLKTGKGFYEWTEDSANALKLRIATVLAMLEQQK